MAKSPYRRRGHLRAGARARQIPADAHEGTPRDFLRRHELESREAAHNTIFQRVLLPKLLPRVADPRNLKLALDHLAHNGDRKVRGLDTDEGWQLTRVLSGAILGGIPHAPKRSGVARRSVAEPSGLYN